MTKPLLLLLFLCAVLSGCQINRPLRVQLSADVRLPERSAIVFFVDGLDPRVVDALMARGELPNIKRVFADGGVRVRNAIAAMPSNTYPNTVTLLTGQFPGHHGILGNRWFDRRTLEIEGYTTAGTFRNSNVHFRDATIFEMLADRLTVAVQLHTRRGATVQIDNSISAGLLWLFGQWISYDRRSGRAFEQVVDLANESGRWPTLVVHYFPGVDEIGHRFGTDSGRYLAAVRNVDAQIGRVAAALNDLGLSDSTYLVLVSDHGHQTHDRDVYFDVKAWVRERCGLRLFDGTTHDPKYARRYRLIDKHDAIVMNGAYRRSAIHLRGRDGWDQSPTIEQIERVIAPAYYAPREKDREGELVTILDHPAVEILAYREGEDAVRIRSRTGDATIERSRDKSGGSRYRVLVHSGDPLRIGDDGTLRSFVQAGWHSSRDWLAATAAARYPDFVPQVVEMFDSPRAGDIVLFGSDHATFYDHEVSGHGSCLAADMRVITFYAGPGIPAGTSINHARNTDLLPTLLDLLGESERLDDFPPIDGVSVADALRNASSAGNAGP